MSSPPPEGFTFRRPQSEDVEVAARIAAAEEVALREVSLIGADEMIDWWRRANLEESWTVETADGRPAAFALLIEHDRSCICWAAVDPAFNGRGLATELISRCELRARARGATVMKAGMFAENRAARALLERHGYREARHFYRMQIELEPPPPPPEWPPGITVSTFRREDARAFYDGLNEAFEGDPTFMPHPYDEWISERVDSPDSDHSLWFIAREGEEIAGIARCDANRYGGGWVGALGVRKPWRRRGLGLALLLHAFAEFRRRGAPHVGLGVDATNPTGATRLYEGAGMRILTEDVAFEKELR